jgi:hypothetical protein
MEPSDTLSVQTGQTPSADSVEVIKTFRKNIDAQILYAESLMGINSASGYPVPRAEITASAVRELGVVRTKRQEAKMWAGKILEA